MAYSKEIIKRDIEEHFKCKVTKMKKINSVVIDEREIDYWGEPVNVLECIDTLKIYTNMKEVKFDHLDYGSPEYENDYSWEHWLHSISSGKNGLALIVKVKYEVESEK